MFWTTIENQKRADGTYGVLYDHFYEIEGEPSAEARAYAKYYTICAAAALSEIPYHSAEIIRSDGKHEFKIFDRTDDNTTE